MTEPKVIVESDAQTLAEAIADRLLARLGEIQADGRVPAVALTGGTIADGAHRAVAARSPHAAVDWSQVDIWWGDERFVPFGHPDRNDAQAWAAFLGAVGVDPDRVHPMPVSDSTDVDAAAVAYGDVVRAHGGGEFDVVMLGVGPDGHVASLFPGFAQLDVRDAIAVAVHGSPKPPPERISLTFSALNRAQAVWFLVSGDGKSDAVARALAGADPHEVPAAGVTGGEETLWLLDAAAASSLPDRQVRGQ